MYIKAKASRIVMRLLPIDIIFTRRRLKGYYLYRCLCDLAPPMEPKATGMGTAISAPSFSLPTSLAPRSLEHSLLYSIHTYYIGCLVER
jgi:hypothetical protein